MTYGTAESLLTAGPEIWRSSPYISISGLLWTCQSKVQKLWVSSKALYRAHLFKDF